MPIFLDRHDVLEFSAEQVATGSKFNHSTRNDVPAAKEDDELTPPSRTRITL